MTFTTSIKEEIAKTDINVIEARYELIAFLNSVAKFNKDEIDITIIIKYKFMLISKLEITPSKIQDSNDNIIVIII